MQESSRLTVGLDVGTTTVRAVVGQVGEQGQVTLIGVGEAANSGMRKGTVVNIVNTAQAIDKALEAAERMSGQRIEGATVSINGQHVVGMSSKGVVAISSGHEIGDDDLARVEEAATVMQLPANREILQVTPRSYQLDGQENIKDPIGMSGVRLEVDAHVITTLTPHIRNLEKACEMTQTAIHKVTLAALAAARAALSDQLIENGVVLIDLGGSTTSLVVYEEGDLQHVAVLPIGSNNVTNDLAIGLKTELEVAEEIKLKQASVLKRDAKDVEVVVNKQKHTFNTEDIDMIVEARLEEVFELINKELKSIGRAAKLPGGAVLTGGGANMSGIVEYARDALQLPARLARSEGYEGMADAVKDPAFTTALGLMMIDNTKDSEYHTGHAKSQSGTQNSLGKGVGNAVSNLLKRFKS